MHLVAAEVFAAARKAYADGTLQAVSDPGSCTYDGPCAIGAAIPKEDRRAFELRYGGCLIGNLIEGEDGVTTDNLGALIWLQTCHDTLSNSIASLSVASGQKGYPLWIEPAMARTRFEELLQAL